MSRYDAVTLGLATGMLAYMVVLLAFGAVDPLFALIMIALNACTCLLLLRRAGAL